MKNFSQMVIEQKAEVSKLRLIIENEVKEKIVPNKFISGALLTGSVARGDARISPLGVHIDLAIVVKNNKDIEISEIFGKDEEPFIPFHCVKVTDKIGIAIEVIEEAELWKIREQKESAIFAKNESIILYDETGILNKWKNESFIITDDQIKKRSLNNFFRFLYLTDDYRLEKWNHRDAYIQINQNLNEASECYCNFLYCINKFFIPRKDWLTYLTYSLEVKPDQHNYYMENLYTSSLNKQSILEKHQITSEIKLWMEEYCLNANWL